MSQDIKVPDIGDFKNVEVIDVLVKPGDVVAIDSPLVTLETEKATMDVPSSAAGVVKSISVKKGDRVSKGSVIVALDESAAKPAAAPAPSAAQPAPVKEPVKEQIATPEVVEKQPAAAAPAAKAAPAPPSPPSSPSAKPVAAALIDEAGFATAHASPSVRKFAREIGVDLARVKGTGVKGRITPDDVKGWVKQALVAAAAPKPAPAAGQAAAAAAAAGSALPKVPTIDFSLFGPIEVKPLGRIQKISGPRLQASWLNVPHVWQMEEADITELEVARKGLKSQADAQGIKVTPLAFIVRACVKALQQFPQVNASLDPAKQNLILKKYMNIGFAADTPNGLMVPVIQQADRKDVYEIARDLASLSEKARAGKLSVAEMQGGCFTISSLGGIGGTSFTPIINAPEVAILGVARAAMKPVYIDDKFEPRLILPFTFAYDHRVIDGAAAARFVTFLANTLRDVKSLLEAVP